MIDRVLATDIADGVVDPDAPEIHSHAEIVQRLRLVDHTDDGCGGFLGLKN